MNASNRVSTTDPESRVMKMADGGFRPAYNVQFATDTALLRGAAGLFAAQSDQVTLSEFRAYVRRIEFEPLYPGVLGIGFTATLPAAERAEFEARAAALAS